MLKLSPSLFFVLKTLPFFLIGQFLALLLNFSPTSVPKNLFLFLSSAAACFCWPKKSFFSLKLLNFWTLFSIFPPIFGPKILFFFLSSAPACFFWPEKSYFLYSRSIVFFFFLNCSFFVHLSQIFPNFLFLKTPFFLFKLSPSLFLFGPKSLLFFFFWKIAQFFALTLQFFPNFWPEKSFLSSQTNHSTN